MKNSPLLMSLKDGCFTGRTQNYIGIRNGGNAEMAKKQMTEAERQANAQRLREWRQRKREEYLAANGGKPPKRGRPTVPEEEQKEKKKLREAKYREQKQLEKPPKPPKPPKEPKTKERPKKALPDLKEILPPEDAEWKAPATCEILCASKDYGDTRRYATIEQRKPAYRPLRLKVVVFGNSIAELKREAAKIGINSFWNYGHVK